MSTVDIVICINIYKMPEYLDKQLASIAEYVMSPYVVILNCNDYMFHALKDRTLPPNVYINPEIINKQLGHGSLTHGIVSNMLYAHEKFSYKYVIILSGRTFFYRSLTVAVLDARNQRWDSVEQMKHIRAQPFTAMNWFWPKFRTTLLAKHYLAEGFRMDGSAHEGLTFSYNVVDNILKFFERHPTIKENLFIAESPVEEFALQTISLNELNPANLEYGFTYIGNGCYDTCDINDPAKFTRKISY